MKLTLTGNLLTITPPRNYVGQFVVEVLVADAATTTRKTMNVKVI